MEYGYYEETGSPLQGRALGELKEFLARAELTYDERLQFTVLIRDREDSIAAAGSLQDGVIKCVAVDPARRGEGLTAAVLTALRREALERGFTRLFLYTKPANSAQFGALGFWEAARTETVLLMEDRRDGLLRWAESIRRPEASGTIGAAVMNCNPMTLGHRYLIETAAEQCDFLYLFVVSEDRSAVPAADRLALVRQSAADLPNVFVTGSGQYLISSATFPDYFLKEKSAAPAAWAELDIAVFLRLAEQLGISRRFVGSEPFCPVTGAYNRAMQAALPPAGVEVVEIPRLEKGGKAVSATAVRELIARGRWEETAPLVPAAVFAYLSDGETRAGLLARMAKG